MDTWSTEKTVLNGWRIVRTLGGERSSRVFEIQRDADGVRERCALKVIRVTDERGKKALLGAEELEAYTEKLERIKRRAVNEVRSLYALRDCPYVMQYYDCAAEEWESETGFGCDFLIRMELLEPLTSLQRCGRIPRKRLIRIGEEIAEALEYCHAHGVIHRDIKPQNIFLDSAGMSRLGDFGVAAISEDLLNRASTAIGTPRYAAPEQFMAITSTGYDERVDIYSLGMVLYELANGNEAPSYTPEARIEADIRARLAGESLPKPPEVDAALWSVIEKACAFKPSNRFKSAGDMRAMLKRAERTLKAPKKSPAVPVACCAAAVLLIAAAVLIGAKHAPAKRNDGNAVTGVTDATELPLVTPELGDPTEAAANTDPETPAEPSSSADAFTLPTELNVGDHLSIGRFECDGSAANGAEPLDWIVFDTTENTCLLVCQNSIKCFELTAQDRDRGYAASAVREWLNGEFYETAFNEMEKSSIEGGVTGAGGDRVTLPGLEAMKGFLERTKLRSYTFMTPTDACMSSEERAKRGGDTYLLFLNAQEDRLDFVDWYPYSILYRCEFETKACLTDGGAYAYVVCPILVIDRA